jgi:putative peptidoglycan lipid II flippase
MSLKSKILRGSLIIGGFSFVADVVALVRDRILTSHFGASRILDVYYSAFKLPDLVFNLLVLGAVSSAFIPVFVSEYKNNEQGAWRVAQNFTTIVFVMVLIVAVVLWFFAGSVVTLIAPGFIGGDRTLAVQLTRIMLLSPVLFSLSTICGSILQSLERFWAYAVAPVLYNTGIIIGAIYFVPLARAHGYPEVLGLGWGVVLGALAHFVLQFSAARRAGFKFRAVFDFGDQQFRKIFRLMIPRTIGLGAYSIDSAVVNALASTMIAGSIAVLNVANNLQFVPISVVGVAVATAVFPKLSGHASSDEMQEFKHKLYSALKNTALVVTPLAIAGIFLSHWAINLLFGIGLFHRASVDLTASVLAIFMFGIPAQSLIPTLSRAFYALHNTRIPVTISVLSIVANLSLAWLFGIHFHKGVIGLAIAFSIAGNINFLLLWISFTNFFKRGIVTA